MSLSDDPKKPRIIPTIAYNAGTVDALDRGKQYSRSDPEEVLRSLNEAWKTIRADETAIRDRDRTIADLHEKLSERDETIEKQDRYLRDKDIRESLVRWAVRLLITAQWGAIGWLATQLFARIPK